MYKLRQTTPYLLALSDNKYYYHSLFTINNTIIYSSISGIKDEKIKKVSEEANCEVVNRFTNWSLPEWCPGAVQEGHCKD